MMHKFFSFLHPLPLSILYTLQCTWILCYKFFKDIITLYIDMHWNNLCNLWSKTCFIWLHSFLFFPLPSQPFFISIYFCQKEKKKSIKSESQSHTESYWWCSLFGFPSTLPLMPWTQIPPPNSSAREGDVQMLKFPQHTQYCTGVSSPRFWSGNFSIGIFLLVTIWGQADHEVMPGLKWG